MKSTRFYKTVIVILLITNLGVLSFVWFRKPPHPPRPGDGPKLSEMIGLEGESKTKVDRLESNHHKDKQKLMHRDAELHKTFFKAIGNEQFPEKTWGELNANKSEIEQMTFDFFNDVSKFCNSDQIIKLKSFVENAMMNVHRPPGPPPRK